MSVSATGVEGATVELLPDRVAIERSGFFASMRQGARVEIPLTDISEVLVSSPSVLLRGVFVVVSPGEAANGGWASNNTNPKAVYFTRDQLADFERLRAAILAELPQKATGVVGGWAPARPTVLVLTARPRGDDIPDLDVDLEERKIVEELERTPLGSNAEVELRPATTVDTLLNDLLRARPAAIHFSGHGLVEGIVIETPGRGATLASEASLLRLCALPEITSQLRLLVLNACLTGQQAQTLASIVPAVVGTLESVTDQAAIAFSKGFYGALGHGTSVASAFSAGVAQVSLETGEDEAKKYALFRRADTDLSSWGLFTA